MATIFVNSGASGANNGTSWTDAYTSIASTTGAAAGDEIRVHKTHSQTGTIGTLNWSNGTVANPVKIFCVDKDSSDALSTGGTVICNSGAMTLSGSIVVDGMTFRNTAAALTLSGSNSTEQRWVNCTLEVQASASLNLCNSSASLVTCENCSLTLASAGANTVTFTSGGFSGVVVIRGGTMTARASGQTTLINIGATGRTYLFMRGVSVANTVTNLATITAGGVLVMQECSLPTYTNVLSATPTAPPLAASVLLERCVSGTISVTGLGVTHYEDRNGTIDSTLSQYRTGGANDLVNANAHSWKVVSNGNPLQGCSRLWSPPMAVWVTSGSKTLTVYIASGGTLQDADCGIEVLSGNETASPSTTSQGRFQNTATANRSSASNLATDTSSWTGSGVGTVQKITASIAPQLDGPLIVRFWLAKPSTTVYVDPLPSVGQSNSRDWAVEGAQVCELSNGGGGAGPLSRILTGM